MQKVVGKSEIADCFIQCIKRKLVEKRVTECIRVWGGMYQNIVVYGEKWYMLGDDCFALSACTKMGRI